MSAIRNMYCIAAGKANSVELYEYNCRTSHYLIIIQLEPIPLKAIIKFQSGI